MPFIAWAIKASFIEPSFVAVTALPFVIATVASQLLNPMVD